MNKRDELISELSTATRSTFTSLVTQFGRENLIGFALYSCEDLTSLGVVGATRKGQTENQYCDADYFLFSTEEWDQMPREDGTQRVNEILSECYEYGESREQENETWYEEYRDLVVDSSLKVLRDMVADGLFGDERARDGLFIILGISDSWIPFREGVDWSRQLNTPLMHQRYCDWISNVIDKNA